MLRLLFCFSLLTDRRLKAQALRVKQKSANRRKNTFIKIRFGGIFWTSLSKKVIGHKIDLCKTRV